MLKIDTTTHDLRGQNDLLRSRLKHYRESQWVLDEHFDCDVEPLALLQEQIVLEGK